MLINYYIHVVNWPGRKTIKFEGQRPPEIGDVLVMPTTVGEGNMFLHITGRMRKDDHVSLHYIATGYTEALLFLTPEAIHDGFNQN